jgi:hypothetical protein
MQTMPNQIRVQQLMPRVLCQASDLSETEQVQARRDARFFRESPKLTYTPSDFGIRAPAFGETPLSWAEVIHWLSIK